MSIVKSANLALRFLLERCAAGRPALAWALGLAFVINRILMFVRGQ